MTSALYASHQRNDGAAHIILGAVFNRASHIITGPPPSQQDARRRRRSTAEATKQQQPAATIQPPPRASSFCFCARSTYRECVACGPHWGAGRIRNGMPTAFRQRARAVRSPPHTAEASVRRTTAAKAARVAADENQGGANRRHNNYRYDDRSLSGPKMKVIVRTHTHTHARERDGLMNIIIVRRITYRAYRIRAVSNYVQVTQICAGRHTKTSERANRRDF